MMRRWLPFILLAACLGMRPVFAWPGHQTATPPVDRELLSRLVASDGADRDALIAANPAVGAKPFRDALAAQGQQLRQRGELVASERHYTALVAIGERLGIADAVLGGLNGLGSVAGTRGDVDAANGYFDRAIRLAETSNNRQALQTTLSGLGIMKRLAGQLTESLQIQLRALELARELNQKASIAATLHNLGLVLQNMGNGARALEYYDESLALKQEIGATPTSLALTLTNIGAVYAEQGDYAMAVEYYTRSYETNGGGADVIATTNNLAQAHLSAGDLDRAYGFATTSLTQARASSNQRLEATALYLLGIISRSRANLPEAEAYQHQALDIRERMTEAAPLIESLIEVGNLLGLRDGWEAALPYITRATAIGRSTRLLNQLWRSELLLGHAYANLGRIDEARVAYEAAVRTVEELRSMAGGGERGNQRYLSERLGPFYGLADLDAREGRIFEAFQTVDRARARFLVDIIAAGQVPTRDLSPQEVQDERVVNDAITAATNALEAEARSPRPSTDRLAVLEAQVARARLRRDAFRGELYARRPALSLARGNTPELTREALTALLPAGHAAVVYMLGETRPWAFVATSGKAGLKVTAHPLPMPTNDLVELSDGLATKIAKRDLSFNADARKAYDALMAPIEARLTGITTLTIVPDGPLWHLPFQALRTPRGRFLIEDRAVSYTPSLAALAALEDRRRERPAARTFLVALGDPAIPAAAFWSGSRTRSLATTRLPEAAREVKALGQLYGRARSEVFVDEAATEAALRAELARASVLHVATHGVLEDRNPMYSHLLLVPGAKEAAADHRTDGRLEAWELLDLGINADIAILSACQTAGGGTGFGEGVIGLSWSLFASGASTAVVSQWEVDSASTTSLMLTFHRRLLAGGARPATPEALRQASLNVLRTPAYRHPFYWAGFITMGAR